MRSGRSLISYVGIEWKTGDPFIPELYNKLKENGKFDKIRFPDTAGIGHRVKSVQNPDMRVTLLQEFAHKNFPKTELLDFALEVEKVTTAKKNNLILNVDRCIGILFVDMMRSMPDLFTEEEVKEVLALGYLNGLFVLGRSIGLISHTMDQKRLKAGLYRHPWDDVLYL